MFKRPFAHVADLCGGDAVDDQVRVVEAAEVLAHQGIGVPDFLEQRPVGDSGGQAGQADLIVVVVEIAKLDARIGFDFNRLMIEAEVGDVDREAVGPHRRHRPHARLIAVDRGEVREAIAADDFQRQFDKPGRINGFRGGAGHRASNR